MFLLVVSSAHRTQAAVATGHPRIWLTPDRLARLKNSAAQNSPRWQKVKASADQAVASGGAWWNIQQLSMAYQVTGNRTYGQKAVDLVMATATDAETIFRHESNGYYYRALMPAVVHGYDWCYDLFTPAQRAQVAKWLMDRADAVWPETNPTRNTGWANDNPRNNYYWGFMMTWPAALAVYGEESRAPKHLDLVLNRWHKEARPVLKQWCEGGAWHEGQNYDSTHAVGLVLDAHRTATGEDFINDADFPFLQQTVLWRLHSTAPNLLHFYHQGDQSRYPTGGMYQQDRDRGSIAAINLTDSRYRGWIRHWLDRINPMTEERSGGWEFIFYDDTTPARDYTAELPTSYFSPGMGQYLKRSDWGPNALYWGIWSSDLIESHQFHDVNGFLIWKGEGWLLGNTAMWGGSGIDYATPYHNNYLIGGKEQQWHAPAGTVLRLEEGTDYRYFAGQGALAYRQHDDTYPVSDYVRKLVQVDPGVFLVYDRLNIKDAAADKKLRLHGEKQPNLAGRKYSWDNGSAKLWGESLLPESGVTVGAQAIYHGKPGQPGALSNWATEITVNGNRNLDHMLNVLQVTELNGTAQPTSAVVAESGNMEGAAVGNRVVLFGKTELVNGQVRYRTNVGSTTQHLVLDLQPGRTYEVALTGSTTSTTTSSTTAKGTLRFNVPAGAHLIVLSAQGSDTTPPAAPTGLSVVAGDAQSRSTWNANGESDLAGYALYRAASASGPFNRLNGTLLTEREYTDAGLANGTTYWYRLTAWDAAGNESAPSAAVSATPAGAPTYSISGTASVGGAGVSGVAISAAGPVNASATTAANGTYTLSGLKAGSYTVSAGKTGLSFGGPQTVTVGPDKTGVDFTGAVSKFVKGINFNGPAVVIEGEQWLSHSQAVSEGLTTSGATAWTGSYSFNLSPSADADTKGMLESLLYRASPPNGQGFSLSQTLPNGKYDVYLWTIENHLDNFRAIDVKVEGAVAASAIGDNKKGEWRKQGPFSANVQDGKLDVEILRSGKGDPLVTGMVIYASDGAGGGGGDPTYAISGKVTADGQALSGATVVGGGKSATTAADGTYSLTGVAASTHTVTVSKSEYDFTPSSQSVTVGPDKTGVDFNGTQRKYTVSGKVTLNSSGLAGVTVSGGGKSATTAADGTYTLTGLVAGTHAVTASRAEYDFSPASQNVTVGPNKTGVDFTATQKTYSISGKITLNSSGLAGVSVTGGGKSATTAADGTYTLTGLAAGTHTVAPALSEFDFTPASQSVTVGPSKSGVDFAATQKTYTVSGKATLNGAGLVGVLIAGGGKSATTAADGTYTLSGLTSGTFSVAASKSGYTFDGPFSVTVGPNKTNVNFVATADSNPPPATFTVSGKVTASGQGLAGATISGAGQSVNTGADGTYTLANVAAGTYTVTATKAEFDFTPASQSVTVGPSKSGVDFTSRQKVYTISGTVTHNGAGLAGVTVTGGGKSATTGASGAYTLEGIAKGTHVVSASKPGFTFSSPQNVSVGPSKSGVNFTATEDTYVIAGVVRVNGSALSGVTVSAGGKSTVSLANGSYILNGFTGGTFSVSASKPGFTFDGPKSVTLGPSVLNLDFNGTAQGNTFSISGTVTFNGAGLSGVTVSAGASSATTGADGAYSITGLVAGTYSVSPTAAAYTFDGPKTVTVGPNATGVNFTASAITLKSVTTRPGKIKGGKTAEGTVTLTGAAPAGGTTVSLSAVADLGTTRRKPKPPKPAGELGIPATVTVPAGKTSAVFPIQTPKMKKAKTFKIEAEHKGVKKSTSLKVTGG